MNFNFSLNSIFFFQKLAIELAFYINNRLVNSVISFIYNAAVMLKQRLTNHAYMGYRGNEGFGNISVNYKLEYVI